MARLVTALDAVYLQDLDNSGLPTGNNVQNTPRGVIEAINNLNDTLRSIKQLMKYS